VQSKGGLALKSFAIVPLPRDVIAEGTIREPQVVTDAIKECVEKAGISGTRASFSVSGREAIVKRVPLPKVTPKELGDAIQLEAEHHIPFAIGRCLPREPDLLGRDQTTDMALAGLADHLVVEEDIVDGE